MSYGGWNPNGSGIYPAHPCAPLKARQGWLTIHEGVSGTTWDLDPVERLRAVVRIPPATASRPYFFAENRQLLLSDSGLPGGGLVLWKVEEGIAPPIKLFRHGGTESIRLDDKIVTDISESDLRVKFTISDAPQRRPPVGRR
jgi:hypothetical protein